jgi:hypothetical protein
LTGEDRDGAGAKLIVGDRGKQFGCRGLIVSGTSGTGRIPVSYIIVPPAATPKMLATEVAHFLARQVCGRESQLKYLFDSVSATVLRGPGPSRERDVRRDARSADRRSVHQPDHQRAPQSQASP